MKKTALREGKRKEVVEAIILRKETVVFVSRLSFKFEVRQNASFCKALEVF